MRPASSRTGSEPVRIHDTMTMIAGVGLIFFAGTFSAPAQAAAQRDAKVYRAVEASRPSVIALLKSIVDVDSGSGDIAGGKRVESILSVPLRAAGAQIRTVPAEVSGVAPN